MHADVESQASGTSGPAPEQISAKTKRKRARQERVAEIEAKNWRDKHEAASAAQHGCRHGSAQIPRDSIVPSAAMLSTQQQSRSTTYAQQRRDDDPRMHSGPFDSPVCRRIAFDDTQLNVPIPMALLLLLIPTVHPTGPAGWPGLGMGLAAHLGEHVSQPLAQMSVSHQQSSQRQQASLPFVYPGDSSAHQASTKTRPHGANRGAGHGVLQRVQSPSHPLTPIRLPRGGYGHGKLPNQHQRGPC